jgi:hypothetical protein
MVRKLGVVREGVIEIDRNWLRIPYAEAEVDSKRLRLVQTNRLSLKRLQTLFKKEPTTIPWLDSFCAGEVFVDIGANVAV